MTASLKAMLKSRGGSVTPKAAPKKASKKLAAKKDIVDTKKIARPEVSTKQLISAEEVSGKKRVEGLMKGYVADIVQGSGGELDAVVRSEQMNTERFCIPPSVKGNWMSKMKSMIQKKAEKIQAGGDERAEQALITDMYAVMEAIQRMPECELSEVDDMIKRVQKDYPEMIDKSFDELVESIQREKTARAVARSSKLKQTRDTKVAAKTEELKAVGVSAKEAKAKAEKDVDRTLSTDSMEQFMARWYRKIFSQLGGYLYDGAGNQDKEISSPCGLKIMMSKDAIQKAADVLSFYGSKDDWIDFYVRGSDAPEKAPLTIFHRMHSKDWPGCIPDMFEGEKIIGEDGLQKRIARLDKALSLKRGDFVSDIKELEAGGYGFEK